MHSVRIAALCGFALLATACGRDEQTIKSPSGEVKITKKGDTATVVTKDGSMKMQMSDKGTTVPPEFPKDVAIINGGVVKMAVNSEKHISLHIATTMAQADVVKFYEGSLKEAGWKLDATAVIGEMSMMVGKKDSRTVTLSIIKADSGSVVQLAASKN